MGLRFMHRNISTPVTRVFVLAAVLLFGSPTLHAGIYLRVDKPSGGLVEGESVEQYHPAWIQLDSCNAGIRTTTSLESGGGLSIGKAQALDFSAIKRLDKASPLLFLACAQGTYYPRAIIEFTDDNAQSGGSRVYLRLTLTGVVVNSLNTSSSDGRPQEALSFAYERIQIDYFMMDSKGAYPTSPTTTSSWNFVTNTK